MEDNTQQQTIKLRKSMMGLLARREHSRQELFQKMQQKGYPPDLINNSLDDFIECDWLSDSRYAEMLLRSRLLKYHGPVKIKMELKQKGVSELIIQQCFDAFSYKNGGIDIQLMNNNNVELHDLWPKLATEALNKKFSSKPVDQKERIRQYRFLQQRGFQHDHIRQALG
ncbi:MAG: regulatory protein RecX [Gammaproteobacteria bacterium]|nr:regulatory protein RecX [Gammaproteobacteria bacterium]